MVHPSTPRPVLASAKKVRSRLEVNTPAGFPGNMAGLCGIASAMLVKELHNRKIPAEICENNQHTFVRSGNFIIDLTATQFGYQRIVALPAKEASRTDRIWHTKRKFRNLSKFRTHQRKNWPDQKQVYRLET